MSMYPIASFQVGSGGQNGDIIFNNIPQIYTHLHVRVFARAPFASADAPVGLYTPALSGAVYYFHGLNGGGGGSASSASQLTYGDIDVQRIPAASTASNIYGYQTIDILDYTNTNKYKVVRTLGGYDANGSGQLHMEGGVIPTLNAIQSLGFTTYGITGTTFVAYSRIDLYGIVASTATGA